MADLLDFSWSAVTRGYEWVTAELHTHAWSNKEYEEYSPENRYLVGRDTYGGLGDSYQVKNYFPLSKEHADLFQIFASVTPNEVGIQQFANEYGFLGGKHSVGLKLITVVPMMMRLFDYSLPDDLPRTPISYQDNYPKGEPFGVWAKQISKMKHAVEIWSLLKKRDEAGLRDYVKWHHKVVELKDPVTGDKLTHGLIMDVLESAAGERRFVQGEISRPALVLLARLINDNLQGQVSPLTLLNVGLESTVLRFVPDNLLGALWLQFAQAVDKGNAYKQCEACGKWFEIGKWGSRADKKTCDGKCRKRLERTSQREKARA